MVEPCILVLDALELKGTVNIVSKQLLVSIGAYTGHEGNSLATVRPGANQHPFAIT